MKVFISWSGELSLQVAQLLKSWVKCVLQATEPWLSSEDIAKGSVWSNEINEQLVKTSVGIICVTRENATAPWIHFEAGALAKGMAQNRVCPLLIDLDKPTELGLPLSQFNVTLPTKKDMLRLINTINESLKEKLPENILQMTFEGFWPKFDDAFKAAVSNYKPSTKPPRSSEEMTEEILQIARQTQSALEAMWQEQQFEKDTREAAAKYARTFGLVNAFAADAFGEGLGLDYLSPPVGIMGRSKIIPPPQSAPEKPPA